VITINLLRYVYSYITLPKLLHKCLVYKKHKCVVFFVTFYKALRSFGDLPDLVVDDTSDHFKDWVEQLMSSMLAGLLPQKKIIQIP
jgi:hypothetical protein